MFRNLGSNQHQSWFHKKSYNTVTKHFPVPPKIQNISQNITETFVWVPKFIVLYLKRKGLDNIKRQRNVPQSSHAMEVFANKFSWQSFSSNWIALPKLFWPVTVFICGVPQNMENCTLVTQRKNKDLETLPPTDRQAGRQASWLTKLHFIYVSQIWQLQEHHNSEEKINITIKTGCN